MWRFMTNTEGKKMTYIQIPVSYTHLDVYKRQGNFTSIFLKEWKYGDGKKNRVRDYCRF